MKWANDEDEEPTSGGCRTGTEAKKRNEEERALYKSTLGLTEENFTPFVFESLGYMEHVAVNLMRRIVLLQNDMDVFGLEKALRAADNANVKDKADVGAHPAH